MTISCHTIRVLFDTHPSASRRPLPSYASAVGLLFCLFLNPVTICQFALQCIVLLSISTPTHLCHSCVTPVPHPLVLPPSCHPTHAHTHTHTHTQSPYQSQSTSLDLWISLLLSVVSTYSTAHQYLPITYSTHSLQESTRSESNLSDVAKKVREAEERRAEETAKKKRVSANIQLIIITRTAHTHTHTHTHTYNTHTPTHTHTHTHTHSKLTHSYHQHCR